MIKFLLQIFALLTGISLVAGFAQSEEGSPRYAITYFEIGGSVGASTEDYEEHLVQSEHQGENVFWHRAKAEVLTSVDVTKNGKSVEDSEKSVPLDGLQRETFEIKRRARTDRVSAEINVNALMTADDAGITIEGHQSITLSPISDDDSGSVGSTGVVFGVSVREASTVRITGCDLFEKSSFQSQPGFRDDGESCSFQILDEEVVDYSFMDEAPDLNELLKLVKDMPEVAIEQEPVPGYDGEPLQFFAELEAEAKGRFGKNTGGVKLVRPFKITIR